jgi:glutamyl-Q tRNA(Asp) synthetase
VAIDGAGEKLSKQTHAAPVPDDPLPALLAAWRFLDQPLPAGSGRPATIAEFWSHAAAAWDPSRLPPVATLPVRAAFGPRSIEPV